VTPQQRANITWPEHKSPPERKKNAKLNRVKPVRGARVKVHGNEVRELQRTQSAPRERKKNSALRLLKAKRMSKLGARSPLSNQRKKKSVVVVSNGLSEEKKNDVVSKNLSGEKTEKKMITPSKDNEDVSNYDFGNQKTKISKGKKDEEVRQSQEQSALDIVLETAMKTPLPKTYCNGDTPKRYVVIKECPLSCAEGPMSTFMIPKGDCVDAVGEIGGWVEIRAFVPKRCLEPHQPLEKRKKKKKKKKSKVIEKIEHEKEEPEDKKKDDTQSSLETTSDTAPPPVAIKRIRSENEIPLKNGDGAAADDDDDESGGGGGEEETLTGTTVL